MVLFRSFNSVSIYFKVYNNAFFPTNLFKICNLTALAPLNFVGKCWSWMMTIIHQYVDKQFDLRRPKRTNERISLFLRKWNKNRFTHTKTEKRVSTLFPFLSRYTDQHKRSGLFLESTNYAPQAFQSTCVNSFNCRMCGLCVCIFSVWWKIVSCGLT